MKAEDIQNHIHAAWVLKRFGYRARPVKDKDGIFKKIQVEKENSGNLHYVYMDRKALINMAKTLIKTRGHLENIGGGKR